MPGAGESVTGERVTGDFITEDTEGTEECATFVGTSSLRSVHSVFSVSFVMNTPAWNLDALHEDAPRPAPPAPCGSDNQ